MPSKELIQEKSIEIADPDKNDWIAIHVPDQPLTTTLLVEKTEYGRAYHYVEKSLRPPLRQSLRPVRVTLYFSLTRDEYRLWLRPVAVGEPHYESIAYLLAQEPNKLKSNEWRVFADSAVRKYRFKWRAIRREITWPDVRLNELLQEALEPDRW